MSPCLLMLWFFVAYTCKFVDAASSKLTRRDRETTIWHTNGETQSYFAPDWPTCSNDRRLTDCAVSDTTANVTVRPDCDSVIDFICNAFERQAFQPLEKQNMTTLSHTNGTCEGHMLFGYPTLGDYGYEYPNFARHLYFNYTTCVWGFQSITETCMLLDEPGMKNYASVGHQAGVLNVFHVEKTSPTRPPWGEPTMWGDYPGYMMGPPGYFGELGARDAADVRADGSLPGRG